MRRGKFEADTVNLFLSEFRNCSMFIDVGAHHGYFSCLANSAGVPMITSIEPDNRNFKILSKNIHHNNFHRNTKMLNIALGAAPGSLRIYGFGTGVSFSKTWSDNVSRSTQEVKMETLDRALGSQLPLFNAVVKIDVEGYELNVIKGAINTINSAVNTLFFVEISLLFDQNNSANKTIAPGIEPLINIFSDAGYSMFKLSENGSKLILLSNKDKSLLINKVSGIVGSNFIFKQLI